MRIALFFVVKKQFPTPFIVNGKFNKSFDNPSGREWNFECHRSMSKLDHSIAGMGNSSMPIRRSINNGQVCVRNIQDGQITMFGALKQCN